MKDKRITMVQWTDLNQNNSFVNPQRLPLLCGIFGAVHLRSTSGSYSRLAGKQISKILKFAKDRNVRVFASFNKGTVLLQQYQCI